MPMDPNIQKEQFSIAYLRTVAAAAGISAYPPEVDDSSIDWVLKGYRDDGERYVPQLELQLKCTANDSYLTRRSIAFDLKKKNYNDLCDTGVIIPRILVMVVVPDDNLHWLSQNEDESILKYCGYWHSLKGESPTTQTQKRAHLNRTNVFNKDNLLALMKRIAINGDL